jgi:DNA replication protein DnaC
VTAPSARLVSSTIASLVRAAAILDRLLHDAEVLTINDPSYRLHGRLEILAKEGGKAEGEANI